MAALNLFEEFASLTRAFEALGVPYAVCGGLALAVHGVPRYTKDIDLLVPRDALEQAKGVARAQGFAAESLPMRFGGGTNEMHRVIKLVGREMLMLDLLIVTEALEPVWSARERLSLDSGAVWTVSRAALIQMKLAAGRPQDLADVAKLSEVT